MKRSLRLCAALSLAVISAASMASAPCAPASVPAGFLPGNAGLGGHGGYGSIICGLPASQNPILGAGAEQERKRTEQRAAWALLLKEGHQATPVKTDAPVEPGALMLPVIKE